MTAEEWRTVAEAPDYDVSNLGRVRSRRRGNPRILKPGTLRLGYQLVVLCNDEGQRSRMVHRLVGEAFIGPLPEGMHTRHLDGDASNNHVENLAYGTPSENNFDIVRHGKHHWANRTHCPQGHPYDESNTYITPHGRWCRECNNARGRRRRALAHAP